jgi:hypothetical protein
MIINKNNIEAFISQIRDIVQQNAFAIVDISESNINRSTAQNAYVFGVLYTQLHKHFLNLGFSMEIEEIHNY